MTSSIFDGYVSRSTRMECVTSHEAGNTVSGGATIASTVATPAARSSEIRASIARPYPTGSS
jgi:hypothetical protein